jgi:hypothetical protein
MPAEQRLFSRFPIDPIFLSDRIDGSPAAIGLPDLFSGQDRS